MNFNFSNRSWIKRVAPFGILAAMSGAALTNTAQPLPSAEAKPAPKIKWRTSLPAAMKEAKRTGKPIMIDFYATWCGPCKLLDAHVYTYAPLVKEMNNWIPVKIDAEQQAAVAQKYDVTGYPTLLYMKPNGAVIKRQSGLEVPVKHQTSNAAINKFLREDTLRVLRALRQRATVTRA